MFNWFKSAPADVPDDLQRFLQQWIIPELGIALSDITTQITYKPGRLTLELGFPLKSLQPLLNNALQQAGFDVATEIRYQQHGTERFKNIRQVILVASGKGGVGKSTTAVNLAVAMAMEGAAVGLLDADIYGPSIPVMLGLYGARVESPDNKFMQPKQAYDIYLQSIGFLVDPEQASVWRGPMASQALLQLLNETLWPKLDYLIVDMPPGTGDIQLTMAQKIPVTGSVIVTTPQDVALSDARKAISMFRQVNIPVLGLVENMSFYQCSQCGHRDDVFGTKGGIALAERYQVPVLGQLPLQTMIRQQADQGCPVVLTSHPVAELYRQTARQLLLNLYWYSQHNAVQQPDIIITDD